MEAEIFSRSGPLAWFIRCGMYSARAVLAARSFVKRPRTRGVRGLPVTPEGRVVLVRHSYIGGWYPPGGGRGADEDAAEAMLREMREEIGMTSHGEVSWLADYGHISDFNRDTISFFVVRDVMFEPKLSLEIEAVGAFALDALPADVTPATARRIAEWRGEAPVSDRW